MPVQTTQKSYIYFPDGALVAIKASGESSYTDIGAISSAITTTLNWDENQVETANAGKLAKQIRNMNLSGGFTLINLNPDGLARMSGGLFTKVVTAGTAVTTMPVQTIAAGWDDKIMYDLAPVVSSSDSTPLKYAAAPTFTSIVLDAGGTPETLTAGNDYVVVANPNSYSGYSITFISGGMTTLTPKTKAITIDYDSVTPVAGTKLTCGSSTAVLDAYAMKITHTDDAGKKREIEIYSVDTDSGAFNFNFKGANEDGVEEMPLTFMAKIDTARTDKDQLFSYSVDTGAE